LEIKDTPKQTLTLTPKLRRELKHPIGTLITGSPEKTMRELHKLIQKEKPTCIISVGDVVSQNMLKQGIQPRIIIVDNRVMRQSSKPISAAAYKQITVKNPAGTLTPQTWVAIEQVLKEKQPVLMLVEGEEDLLTLVAVLEAPEDSLVVYGQPHEGVVVVKADKATKEKVHQIVEAMQRLPKS